MHRTIKLVVLSLFSILSTVLSQDPTTVYSSKATDEDVGLLAAITWEEALPLVLFATNGHVLLQCPGRLRKAKIEEGRLIQGTEFKLSLDSKKSSAAILPLPQIFFCPKPPDANTSDNCLAPTKFTKSQILQCEYEPTPIMEENPRKKCGSSKNGIMLRFLYKICPSKRPYQYITTNIPIYSLCYDQVKKKILFADYNISSAKLLSDKLLTREREIVSHLSKNTYNIIDPIYYLSLERTPTLYTQYHFQMLVPTNNMPLATWRKTTNTFANVAMQHVNLIELWNGINRSIQINAEESALSPRKITTGVIDIPIKYLPRVLNANQIYGIWITIIVDTNDEPINGKIITEPTKGIAIMMNNYITNGQASSSMQYIDVLCDGTSQCVDTLIDKFTAINGEVRCCQLTNEIKQLFWGSEDVASNEEVDRNEDFDRNDDVESNEDVEPQLEILEIRDITYRQIENEQTEQAEGSNS